MAEREGEKAIGGEELTLFPRPLKMKRDLGGSKGKLTIKNY
jgi:hypothetical protein